MCKNCTCNKDLEKDLPFNSEDEVLEESFDEENNYGKMKIERTDNGYILTDFGNEQKTVHEGDLELDALVSLFWQIKEGQGAFYSKHKKNNVMIGYVHGEHRDDSEDTIDELCKKGYSALYDAGYEVIKRELE